MNRLTTISGKNKWIQLLLTAVLFFMVNRTEAVNYNMSTTTVTTCSGNFYDSGGSGSNYSANENFTMTFTPSTSGQYMTANFTSFNTQTYTDLLYVYDGPNTSSPLMGIYTGSTGPGTIGARSANGSLTFKFTSNNTSQFSGWAATLACSATPGSTTANYLISNNAVDTVCGGTFYDSGGSSGNYTSGENNTMTFYPATPGQFVQFIFTSFTTGTTLDYLSIYDGPNTSSPLMGAYDGTLSPDTITARNNLGCLTFYFFTNTPGNFSGWTASISCSAIRGSTTAAYPLTNNAVDTVCGGKFYDGAGAGNNYSANENKSMTFYPATAGQYLTITFSAFSTQLVTDYFYIYDGPNTSSPLIGMYSGTISPGTIGARNSLGCLTFKFTSNNTSQSSGWSATFSCSASKGSTNGIYPMTNSAVDTVCGGTFYDCGGNGNDYDNSETKTMTFFPATSGQYLQVTFSMLQTETVTDYLYIYDGPSTASQLMGIYSGSTNPGTIGARNSQGCLTFKFTSNNSSQMNGWAATFSCSATKGSTTGVYFMTASAVDTICGGTFYDCGGLSNNYDASETKTMTFYPATSGQYLTVTFSAFVSESLTDYLYIYDGPSTASPLMGIYSGSTTPGTIGARNSSGCLTFKFTSNNSSQLAGWTATFACSATKGSSTGNYFMTDTGVDTICGGTFYDCGGFSNNYNVSENKTMTFFPATAGQYLTVTFSAFTTELFYDYLYIYDGPSTASTLIGIYSGTTSPNVIGARNAQGCLTFKFTSDNTVQNAGWTATFACSATAGSTTGVYPMSNGAIVTACGGTFYDSGGNANNYNLSETKTMTIYPGTSGQYVNLIFSTFSVEGFYDLLYIYDGASTSSPLIAIYTATSSPDTITARNPLGCLTIYYVSDNSVQNAGWAATISCSATAGTSSGSYPMTNNAVDTICGGRFYDTGGSAGNYYASETKTMTFFPSSTGQFLSANFSAFATEALYDFLYVYDGPNVSSPLLGIYNGSSTPCTFIATNYLGALTFKYISDNSGQFAGWSATFNCVANACTNTGCYPVTNNAVIHACGGNFYDSGGSTGNYAASENSTMTFYPTSGQYVQLIFSSFTTQASTDYLYLYDGPTTASPLLGTYSGATSPGTITATNASGCITAKFTSNNSNQQAGWAASVGCTGTGSTTTWTGNANTTWTQINNWSNLCTSPACAVSAVIPVTSNSPVIAANTNVKNLTVNSGATLTVNAGVTLTVCGDFTNNGTISLSPTSTLLFNNAAVTQNMSGTLTGANKIGNITITKTGGSVVLANDLDIGGNFTTTNSTSIFNSAGKYIKVAGNFSNSSGGTTFTNAGTTGTLQFNGTSAQTFTPGGSLTLNNVVMNNTSTGVTLSGNNLRLGTSGTLTLTAGNIITGSNEVTINNTASAAVTVGSATSYVQGNLRRYLNGAATAYDFPVGNSTNGYQRAKVTFTTTTLIPDLLASFTSWGVLPSGPLSSDCIYANYSLLPVLDNGYWQINASSNSNSGSFTMNLYNTNYTNDGYAGGWSVITAATGAGPWGLSGTCVTTSIPPLVGRTVMNGFGAFTTGQNPNALPIALTTFKGYAKERENIIEWSTSLEINNNYFTLEKSADGNNFEELTRMDGAGNSNENNYYNFADEHPIRPIEFYRLKQTDYDGQYTYSKIISVENKSEQLEFSISPNPNKGMFNLQYNSNADGITNVDVINSYGQIIFSQSYSVTSGIFYQEINLGELPDGIYFLEMRDDQNKIAREKLIIKQ